MGIAQDGPRRRHSGSVTVAAAVSVETPVLLSELSRHDCLWSSHPLCLGAAAHSSQVWVEAQGVQ